MQIHQVAKLFPPMSEEQFRELKNNIAMVGLLVQIMTFQGEIIDGVHRYRACEELGIEPRILEWNGTGSLVELVISLNRHRRHLTPDQLAAVASESAEWLAHEAR